MDENWQLSTVEIRGGFLQELSLHLPAGLTCIIGPRGSGKSTLAEALRYGMTGLDGATKQRLDLFKGNLAKAVVTLKTAAATDGKAYTIRREGKQPAILTMQDGRVLSTVDLDRGTFLPFEGYSSAEIEEIAEERLGPKRRSLLDELRVAEMHSELSVLSTARRDLEANADQVRAARRKVDGLNEQIQVLADAPDRLTALTSTPLDAKDTEALQLSARQVQANRLEAEALQHLRASLNQIVLEVESLQSRLDQPGATPVERADSRNRELAASIDKVADTVRDSVRESLKHLNEQTHQSLTRLDPYVEKLLHAHLEQEAEFAALREQNEVVGEAMKERAEAAEAVRKLKDLEEQRNAARVQEQQLLESRKGLRGRYMHLGERISQLREVVAEELDAEAGDNVRIRVRRNGDHLTYQQKISEGLYGSGVRNHETIIERVSRLRPDELAQLIHERAYADFESVCQLGLERSQRILDSLRSVCDPLDLEIMRMEDMISIELNVGTEAQPVYKDASDLSRGQKCTALLPLLLARRRAPLVIDQPEDNLDNHFIFRTVVETIKRLKHQRQMIFITHNANIPVLAEADLVIVMGSDGRIGYVEKSGTLDECSREIVDLLEGGAEAFELRRKRYGRG